jgi:hypothetical protein
MLDVMRSDHARKQRAHGISRAGVREAAHGRSSPASRSLSGPDRHKTDNVLAARQLNRAAGTLAASVLADSAVEHYRGSFKNKAMLTPIVVAGLTLAMSLHGTADKQPVAHNARDTSYLLAAGTGLLGTGFHIYNVTKKVGGFSWQNLFYGAPLGAPMAILLSGLLGFCSERLRANGPRRRPRVLSLPAGKTVATVAALGLLGTSGEAGLLHFRGAFHNPLMAIPVTLPPIGAGLLGATAAGSGKSAYRATRWWMRLLVVMGFAGVGLHAYGISRNMGGWRNWTQNILNGPPLPAPPSFAGLALAGLAALELMKESSDG